LKIVHSLLEVVNARELGVVEVPPALEPSAFLIEHVAEFVQFQRVSPGVHPIGDVQVDFDLSLEPMSPPLFLGQPAAKLIH
jgi:hypothetical protein